MVIKEVKTPKTDFMTKGAKEVKTPDIKTRLAHTRKCYEMNNARDCKQVVEKSVSPEQQIAYGEIFEKQRLKDERYMKRITKDQKKNPEKCSMIIEGQI